MLIIILVAIWPLFAWLNSWTAKNRAASTSKDVVDALEEFINGPDRDDWDMFIIYPINEPSLEDIRRRCIQIGKDFPPANETQDFCNPEGVEAIKKILVEVKRLQMRGDSNGRK